MIPALESLQRLKDGNARFASNVRGLESFLTQERRAELAKRQKPFAIILGCSDSRVPAEIVFDQGLGDLFVIRVAGNIVAPSQVGSVEFAAERFGTRLVVVLGHSQCGAILATLEQLAATARRPSPNLHSIVDRVRPSVEALLDTPLSTTSTRWSARRCAPTCDVGRSPAPRLRTARGADRARRTARGRRRVLARNRKGRLLRRSAVGTG